MSGTLLGDGSAAADARRVLIDRDDEPYRWVCPNGHTSWDRTNEHIWCHGCHKMSENGADVDPEYWEIVDQLTGETIAWSSVRVVGDE